MLLNLSLKDSELWHTPDDVPCVTLQRHGHREHWPLRSKDYSRHLAAVFYEQENHIVASKTMQDVIDTLEGKAKFDGPTHHRHLRVANHDGRIYIDLVNDGWQAIEVDPSGWRIVNNPPVRFYRSKRALPLPMPVKGGVLAELRPFVNVTDECWPLVLGWLIGAFRPDSKYPILKIIGEQGSAKTTTARVLRALIDPNTCPTRGTPRAEQDLMIAAQHNWVCAFDNLSHLSTDLSDAICRLSTGGGYGNRTHYENEEETVFHSTRPILLNGIEDIGTRSDLMDRALVVELPRIPDKHRKSEKSFYDEFVSAHPPILGAILDAIVEAMNNLPRVENTKTEWPRMVDFAQWAVAAEPAMGIEPGEFMEAYRENRKSANQVALESSPVASALEELLKRNKGGFKGTATVLLGHLTVKQGTSTKDWPKNHRALSGILKRLAPNLRQSGWVVEQDREGNEKLWRIALPKSLPSASSQSTQKNTTVPRPTPGRGMHIDAPPQSNVSKKLAERFLADQGRVTG